MNSTKRSLKLLNLLISYRQKTSENIDDIAMIRPEEWRTSEQKIKYNTIVILMATRNVTRIAKAKLAVRLASRGSAGFTAYRTAGCTTRFQK